MTRQTELPHHEHVERSAQRARHLVADGYTPAGQRQDHHVAPARESLETIGDDNARLAPVGEASALRLTDPLHDVV
jgi:hypothetical protein